MSWKQIDINGNTLSTTISDIDKNISQGNIINQDIVIDEDNFVYINKELIVLNSFELKENSFVLIEGGSYNDLDIGIIIPYAGKYNSDVYSRGFLPCDGRFLDTKQYPELFRILGFKFGRDPEGTKFALPNLKGRVIIGMDINRADYRTIGSTGGLKQVTLTIDEMPRHRHSISRYMNKTQGQTNSILRLYYSGSPYAYTSYTGENEPHNNIIPVQFVNFLIKYSF